MKAHGKTPQVLCKLAASSWWWTWMTVIGTVYHNPRVWSWSGGYQQWALSTLEDSHLHADKGREHSVSLCSGYLLNHF